MPSSRRASTHIVALLAAFGLLATACGGGTDATSSKKSTRSTSTTVAASNTTDATATVLAAAWADDVTITVEDGKYRILANGLPNHERQAEYALPDAGVMIPTADTATAGADPTVEQSYDFSIPTAPTKAATSTSTSLGTIGIMVSGAALFNPYEGDGTTVATASNFTVKNAAGDDIAFLDTCNGHPTPMGEYHYHALPKCITSVVDGTSGPSRIIGIAFDGYLIYGNRDVDGKEVTAGELDECNGITSPTPEFPEGIYHYVLLDTADSMSSIRCFTGTVDASLSSMGGMPPGGPGGGPGGRPPGAGAIAT